MYIEEHSLNLGGHTVLYMPDSTQVWAGIKILEEFPNEVPRRAPSYRACLWFADTSAGPARERTFQTVGTGDQIDNHGKWICSFQEPTDQYSMPIWHVFDITVYPEPEPKFDGAQREMRV